MKTVKKLIKRVFVLLSMTNVLDQLLFSLTWLISFPRNYFYKLSHSEFSFPPNYYMYETYRLDYKLYREDGKISANEIISWAKPYLSNCDNILEWGCGVARITRHLTSVDPRPKKVVGVDINASMISWNKLNIPGVEFSTISYLPPMQLDQGDFDLAIGLSVFTHIECEHQLAWIEEIRRVLRLGGVFITTTHGCHFHEKLTKSELIKLNSTGCYTTSYKQKGHRMMSTYAIAASFRKHVEQHFDVLEYYDGRLDPSKTGGQDLWILRAR